MGACQSSRRMRITIDVERMKETHKCIQMHREQKPELQSRWCHTVEQNIVVDMEDPNTQRVVKLCGI